MTLMLIGNLNLIKLTFDSMNETNKLKFPSFEEMFPDKEENEHAHPIVNEFFLRISDLISVKKK